MRILVTGGAGFLGSHLVDRLTEEGHRVLVLDDLSTGRIGNLASAWPRLSFRRGSVLDPVAVSRAVAGVDRVVHLASPVGVDRVAARPGETERVIAGGGRLVLKETVARGVPCLVVSSSEVYGFSPVTPIHEDDVPAEIAGDAPRLAYPRAKLALDRAARALASNGFPVLVVRPFNLVGARQDAGGGAVLPRFCERAKASLPLEVHGDGLQRRVFLDVRDAARMVAALASHETWPYDAVNLGGTEEWSIGALAHRVVLRLDARVAVRLVDPPATRGGVEIRRRVPDLGRLASLVDVRPRHSVDDAIRAVAEELVATPGRVA